ncbi:E3 ubiquitin-protein ligase rnf146 [Anopheles ziemanni]|uniref:E3 ubiquitin-protein ligase rnf146 n=1 Tax=Anopheles coustani TaxID=139045 RepID=UPI00265A1289|nr:E3 ubiquitin-protein ligase rnf146 [Anopheles coustani]XP_058178972.1 E3 ubiquitin-protein ligase rnf146 [Anopheles ziemanni]
MAESLQPGSSSPTSARSEDGDSHEIPKKPDGTTASSKLECPVCLETCVHPVRLPCGHIFCYLCVKGVAFKNLRCALCRCDIPLTYIDHPQLVNGVEEIERAATSTVADGNEYQWYYEGCNGWWQYDERTSQELEEAYLEGKKSCKILVAGFVYIVMFELKCQIRQNDCTRIRRVKRDLVTIQKKGVAGLRLEGVNQTRVPGTSTTTASNDLSELSSAMGEMNLNEGASTSTSAAGSANVTENVATTENAAPSQPTTDVPEAAVEKGEHSGTRTNHADEPHSDAVLSPNTSSDSTSSDNRTSEQTQEPLPLIDLNVQQEYFTTDEEEGDDDDNLLIL